jgi:hypothetical protein
VDGTEDIVGTAISLHIPLAGANDRGGNGVHALGG